MEVYRMLISKTKKYNLILVQNIFNGHKIYTYTPATNGEI
jgi:hypothetical protein